MFASEMLRARLFPTPKPTAAPAASTTLPSNLTQLISELEAENQRLRTLTASLPGELRELREASMAADEAARRQRAKATRRQTLARALIVLALMLGSFAAGLRMGAAADPGTQHGHGMSWRPATTAGYESPTPPSRPNGVGLLHVRTVIDGGAGRRPGSVGLLWIDPWQSRAGARQHTPVFGSFRLDSGKWRKQKL